MKKLISSDINDIIEFIKDSARAYHLREKPLNNTLELVKNVIPIVVDKNQAPVEVQVYRRSISRGKIRFIVKHEKIDFASEFSKVLENINIEKDVEGPDAQDYINDLILSSHYKDIQYKHRNGKNIVTISVSNITNSALYSTISAFAFAIVLGIICKTLFVQETIDALTAYVFNPVSTMFLNALSMAAYPLIFVTIALCIANIGTVASFGKIGGSSVKVYLASFGCIAFVCLFFSIILHIGDPSLSGAVSSLPTDGYDHVATNKKFIDVIIEIVPSNIISPFLDGSVLSVLFMGILFGIVLSILKDKVPMFLKLIEEINKIFLKIVEVVILFLPLAIICNVTKLILGIPIESLYSVLQWIFEMLVITVVVFIIYGIGIVLFARVNPIQFFKKSLSTWLTANAIGSSTVSMPKGMEACKDCGVDPKVYSITMPLGTSLNKNGSVISNIVTAIFMCNIFSVDIDPTIIVTLTVMVLIFSVAAPAVNGGGIICMSAIYAQLGIPAAAIGLYIVINPIVDLMVTGTNVLGNIFASVIVAARQKMFNKKIYLKDKDEK